MSALDVDNTRETIQLQQLSSYTVETPTDLTITVDQTNQIVDIIGGTNGYSPTSVADTTVIIEAHYEDVTSIIYRAGVDGNLTRQTASLFESVTFNNPIIFDINDAPQIDLDADDSTAIGNSYAVVFDEGGSPVAIADIDASVSDVDDTALASVKITPSGMVDARTRS